MQNVSGLAEIATLIGDPARANMLLALKDEGPLAAAVLAHIAGIAPNTASGHLAKLAEAGLVVADRRGRHRFYRLTDRGIAELLETLEEMAAHLPLRCAQRSSCGAAVRNARRCYDHLAGALGTGLTRALIERRCLMERDGSFALGRGAAATLAGIGIDLPSLRADRRPLLRHCLDWSERQPHLGGGLGAALYHRFTALDWIRPIEGSRAVALTRRGEAGLKDWIGLGA